MSEWIKTEGAFFLGLICMASAFGLVFRWEVGIAVFLFIFGFLKAAGAIINSLKKDKASELNPDDNKRIDND